MNLYPLPPGAVVVLLPPLHYEVPIVVEVYVHVVPCPSSQRQLYLLLSYQGTGTSYRTHHHRNDDAFGNFYILPNIYNSIIRPQQLENHPTPHQQQQPHSYLIYHTIFCNVGSPCTLPNGADSKSPHNQVFLTSSFWVRPKRRIACNLYENTPD
jgi:hypothetical protein